MWQQIYTIEKEHGKLMLILARIKSWISATTSFESKEQYGR